MNQSFCIIHSVHPFLSAGGEVEPPSTFSNREGDLTGPQFLEGDCWERGGDFFQGMGGAIFQQKNKLKSGIFSDKKSLSTRFFCFVVTKNSNWEILTENVVTFKRYGVKDEKL